MPNQKLKEKEVPAKEALDPKVELQDQIALLENKAKVLEAKNEQTIKQANAIAKNNAYTNKLLEQIVDLLAENKLMRQQLQEIQRQR